MGLGGAKFRLPALISVFRLGIRKPYHDTVEAALAHLDAGKQIKRVVDAIRATPEVTAQKLRELDQKKAMTLKGLKILRAGKPDAYEKAGAALHQDTQAAWEDNISGDPEDFFDDDEDEEPVIPNAADLMQFLEQEVLPWYVQRRKELENRPLICAQAFGESLDPDRLERLGRYEVHLDRKLERTLTILIRLKALRCSGGPD